MGIKEPVGHIPWNKEKWRQVRGEVKEIEDRLSMENSEIQQRILEILREKNE